MELSAPSGFLTHASSPISSLLSWVSKGLLCSSLPLLLETLRLPQPASFAPVFSLTLLVGVLGSVFLLFKNAKCFSNIWIKKGSISFINS